MTIYVKEGFHYVCMFPAMLLIEFKVAGRSKNAALTARAVKSGFFFFSCNETLITQPYMEGKKRLKYQLIY